MQAHVMVLAFVYEFGVFNLDYWLDFIDVFIASYQCDDVVRVESHVFVGEVVGVIAPFDAYHADFELAAEHGILQMFSDDTAQRADDHFLEMEVLL